MERIDKLTNASLVWSASLRERDAGVSVQQLQPVTSGHHQQPWGEQLLQ